MITTKRPIFIYTKSTDKRNLMNGRKKKKVYFHGINTGYLLPSCVVTFGQCSSLKPPKKLKWSLQLLYIDCKLKEQTWQVCVMRWNKVQVYKPDENKWAASWWNEQRQLRRNWLNQSFILFPPICCAVIGVRVTGRMTPSSLIRLNTYMPTHPSLLSEQTVFCVQVPRKMAADRAYKWEEHKASFTNGDAISTGAVGGYQGDSSTSVLPRWPLCHCHLSLKTHMCRIQLRVLPTV